MNIQVVLVRVSTISAAAVKLYVCYEAFPWAKTILGKNHFLRLKIYQYYRRGGNSGNPHMNHLYIHMFALTCSPRYPLQAACISHLLHLSGKKTTLVVIFFNDLLDIIDIRPTLPNLVLRGNCFPHIPGPES